jgi:DHA1 family multidrug resistance protein-like MFS transporter
VNHVEPWKRTMWILWVGVLLCSASYTMAVPFLPLFLFDLGVDKDSVNLWAGIVHSSAFLVGAIMAPLWGSVADKYGKRKMVIRAGLSLAFIYSLLALVQNPWQLIGVRMLHGFVGGFVPASMAIVASVVPQNKLGSSLGMMQAGTMTGGILGPLFGGLLATWFGQRMSFVVAGGIIFTATLAVIIWVSEGRSAPSKRTGMQQGIREAFQNQSLVNMLLLLVVFQLSINMIQPLLTLHIADLQGSLDNAVLSSGIIFSLIGIAGIIASPFWGRLGEIRGYGRLLAFCLICSGFIVTIQFFVQELWLFTVVHFTFGIFLAGIVPSINTLMVRSTDESFRGRSFGLTAGANQMGSMIGPLLGGAMGYFLSISWIFVTTGLLLLTAGLMVVLRFRSSMPELK